MHSKLPINRHAKIFVAGRTGMVGSSIIRKLSENQFTNIMAPSSNELDLTRQSQVEDFFKSMTPEFVFVAAAKVGGIYANSEYPGDFIYSNLCIQNNIIHSAYLTNVRKLLFLGSSCIYPKNAEIPIKEESLLTGELEPTNEAYAIAKIAGVKMCKYYNKQYRTNFISVMPTNLYGPGDNYNLLNAHVLPALLRKFHEAKVTGSPNVTVWGSGKPKREFLFVDDLADACLFLMENYSSNDPINVGSGAEISISDLALLVSKVIGYNGKIIFDGTKPDGTYRKLMDSGKLKNLGWSPAFDLVSGLKKTYEDFLQSHFLRDK